MPFPSVAISVGIYKNILIHSREVWNHFIKRSVAPLGLGGLDESHPVSQAEEEEDEDEEGSRCPEPRHPGVSVFGGRHSQGSVAGPPPALRSWVGGGCRTVTGGPNPGAWRDPGRQAGEEKSQSLQGGWLGCSSQLSPTTSQLKGGELCVLCENKQN